MIDNNQSIFLFLKQLQKVPYLASKNLYVVAQYFLDLSLEEANKFCSSIKNIKENTEKCNICFIWKEKDKNCDICFSNKRDKEILCVLENWRDLIALERTGVFTGHYHVLGGTICPLDGIGPEDLTIKQLIKRVEDFKFKEIIFALNQTPEAETTIAYIVSKIKKIDVENNIIITCIARGLPVGASLEFTDRLTVSKAVMERRVFL